MIVLATDFGLAGPYTGQMKAALASGAPGVPVLDLFADLPSADPRAAAYLLAAYDDYFPHGAVFLCVVDPGVGSARRALCLQADGQWYVGPDNGLFDIVVRRAAGLADVFGILWKPERVSASFHGRDLFAPIAARLAAGEDPRASVDFQPLDSAIVRQDDWPDDLPEVVYIDHYGNVLTGLRAAVLGADAGLSFGGRNAPRAETFSSVSPGEVFCYENSNGLMEIAINQGNAAVELGLRIGDAVLPSEGDR